MNKNLEKALEFNDKDNEKYVYYLTLAADEGDAEAQCKLGVLYYYGDIVAKDYDKAVEAFRQLSLKFTSDIEYIDSEIQKLAKATLCYELRPEHITGKLVNES